MLEVQHLECWLSETKLKSRCGPYVHAESPDSSMRPSSTRMNTFTGTWQSHLQARCLHDSALLTQNALSSCTSWSLNNLQVHQRQHCQPQQSRSRATGAHALDLGTGPLPAHMHLDMLNPIEAYDSAGHPASLSEWPAD